jgi:uncharacterized membrane-anchored protein
VRQCNVKEQTAMSKATYEKLALLPFGTGLFFCFVLLLNGLWSFIRSDETFGIIKLYCIAFSGILLCLASIPILYTCSYREFKENRPWKSKILWIYILFPAGILFQLAGQYIILISWPLSILTILIVHIVKIAKCYINDEYKNSFFYSLIGLSIYYLLLILVSAFFLMLATKSGIT